MVRGRRTIRDVPKAIKPSQKALHKIASNKARFKLGNLSVPPVDPEEPSSEKYRDRHYFAKYQKMRREKKKQMQLDGVATYLEDDDKLPLFTPQLMSQPQKGDWRPIFLEALAHYKSLRAAYKVAGVSAYRARKQKDKDSFFSDVWDDVWVTDVLTPLEANAMRRAIYGWEEPLFHQGRLTGDTKRVYSDTLTIFMLKAHLPERYNNDNTSVTNQSVQEITSKIRKFIQLARETVTGKTPDNQSAVLVSESTKEVKSSKKEAKK